MGDWFAYILYQHSSVEMTYFRSAEFENISRTRRYAELGDTKMCELIEFKDISDGDNYLRRDEVNWYLQLSSCTMLPSIANSWPQLYATQSK